MVLGHIDSDIDNCFFHGLVNSCLYTSWPGCGPSTRMAQPGRSNNRSSLNNCSGCRSHSVSVLALTTTRGGSDLAAALFLQQKLTKSEDTSGGLQTAVAPVRRPTAL